MERSEVAVQDICHCVTCQEKRERPGCKRGPSQGWVEGCCSCSACELYCEFLSKRCKILETSIQKNDTEKKFETLYWDDLIKLLDNMREFFGNVSHLEDYQPLKDSLPSIIAKTKEFKEGVDNMKDEYHNNLLCQVKVEKFHCLQLREVGSCLANLERFKKQIAAVEAKIINMEVVKSDNHQAWENTLKILTEAYMESWDMKVSGYSFYSCDLEIFLQQVEKFLEEISNALSDLSLNLNTFAETCGNFSKLSDGVQKKSQDKIITSMKKLGDLCPKIPKVTSKELSTVLENGRIFRFILSEVCKENNHKEFIKRIQKVFETEDLAGIQKEYSFWRKKEDDLFAQLRAPFAKVKTLRISN